MMVTTEPSDLKVGYDPQAKQVIAEILSRYAKHTLFGGAAGPGKTAWLANKAAVRLATKPGTHILIGRRTNKELKSIARTIRNWLPESLASFNANQQEFKSRQDSPIGPGWIRLHQFFREEDVSAHLGEEYDLIELDEATGFTKYQRNLLRSRNRHPLYGDDCSMAYASNPGGVGHHDFLNEFVRPRESNVRLLYYWDFTAPTPHYLAKYGVTGNIMQFPEGFRGRPQPFTIWQPDEDEDWYEINEQRARDGLEPIGQASRVYVPGVVQDNKYIWEMNPDYVAELMALPEKMRNAYLKGDWDAFEGQVFEEFDTRLHVIDLPYGIEPHWRKWRSLDWGYRAELACLWHAYSPELDMVITYRELYKRGLDDLAATDEIKALTPHHERIDFTDADPKMWAQEGFEGMTSHAQYYEDKGVPLRKAINRRLDGKSRVHTMLAKNEKTGRPRWACTADCRNLIRTLPVLVYEQSENKIRAEDVDTTGEDHLYDALRYGLMAAPSTMLPPRRTALSAGAFWTPGG